MSDSNDTDGVGDGLHVDMDVSDAGDDTATPTEAEADAEDVLTADQEAAAEERAKEEAQRYLKHAEGGSPYERATEALGDLRETVENTEAHLRQAQQAREKKQARREKLADTRERVEAQPDECDILQTLGGGVTLEVPPEARPESDDDEEVAYAVTTFEDAYTREDLVVDIEETREALAEQLEELDERIEHLETAMDIAEGAFEQLHDYREMSADMQPDVGAGGAGGGPAPDGL